jgi:hypothetical protein
MNEELARWLADISAYSVLLPLAIGLVRWKKLDHIQRILMLLLFISFLFEFGAVWVNEQLGLPNLPLLHLFTVIQFTILISIFHKTLAPLFSNRWLWGLLIGFGLFAVADALFLSSLQSFNPLARLVESLILIACSFLYLNKTLQELKIQHLDREPMFWISAGVLIYFAGGFLIFISSNYIMPIKLTFFLFWGLHAVLNTIANLFYFIALCLEPQD